MSHNKLPKFTFFALAIVKLKERFMMTLGTDLPLTARSYGGLVALSHERRSDATMAMSNRHIEGKVAIVRKPPDFLHSRFSHTSEAEMGPVKFSANKRSTSARSANIKEGRSLKVISGT